MNRIKPNDEDRAARSYTYQLKCPAFRWTIITQETKKKSEQYKPECTEKDKKQFVIGNTRKYGEKAKGLSCVRKAFIKY